MKRVYQEIEKVDSKTKKMITEKLSEDFAFEVSEIPYPDDSETKEEIHYLADVASRYRESLKEIIKIVDEDVSQMFLDFLAFKGMKLTDEEKKGLDSLIEKSVPFLVQIKYRYNRPRPYQDAKYFGIEFSVMDSETAKTPAYPSGHTFQAYLIADYLSRIFPKYMRKFYEVAEKIAATRIIGGYHYPSDNKYSKILFKEYKLNRAAERGLDSSIGVFFDDKEIAEKLEFNDLIVDINDWDFVRNADKDPIAKYGSLKKAFEALNEKTRLALEKKAKDHNEEVNNAKSKRTTKLKLGAVYWRGIGAYKFNPDSVRPTVKNAPQWAMARVNSFLYALKKGKFKSGKHDTDLLPESHPMSNRSKEEITNFPKKGENLKVSLRNSNWETFPVAFAEKIKNDYPQIWKKGGNIKGNDQYKDLKPVVERGGVVKNKTEEDAVKLREAWVARHFKDFRIAGVIAQIKWFAVGSRGLDYMKELVREEMKKIDKKRSLESLIDEDFEILESSTEEGVSNSYLIRTSEPQQLSMYVDYLQIKEADETRDLANKKDKNFLIKGIASSTSVDHYGTEMSLNALRSMEEQVSKGVVILPRHESMSGGAGIAEWDEVIGRTLSSKIVRADTKDKNGSKIGHVLEVTSQLYGEDERTKNLMKRLSRGELIGQSIGGWFENVRVEESLTGEIERVIVEDVTLDHIAITRAPANPDSYGLSLLNVRNKLKSFLKGRNKMNIETEDTEDFNEVLTEPLETRNLDSLATIEDPLSGEKMPHGDAMADDSNAENPYVIAKEEIDKVEAERAVEDEDLQEKEDHYKGAEKDDADQIEKLEEDEDYDKDKREEYERMKETLRMKEEEIERMKEMLRMKEEEMERMKDMKLDQSEFDEGKESEGTKLYDEDVINSVRSALPLVKMSLAPVDTEWNWDTRAENEVLGENDWKRYAKAHLYIDDDSNPETKSAYKLPMARMIDGELRMVFRGLVAAMAALNGARGGVKIPKEDRAKIYDNVKSYYAMFEKEAPELRSYEECFDDGYEVGYEEGYENASSKLSKTAQDTDNKFDNKTNLNHASTDGISKNNPEETGENIMNPEQLKSIIEQVTRSVVEQIAPATKEVTESKEPETDNVAELKARLERAEITLAKVMETPLRAGRHLSTTITGVGSRSAFEDLVTRSQDTGVSALTAVVKNNLDKLSTDSIAKLTNHELRNLLTAGLRGAQQDGLLGTPVSGWQ